MNRNPIVAVDLDGVLSDGENFKFKNGRWDDYLIISDPLPGAVDFVKELSQVAEVLIHSSRLDSSLHDHDERVVAAAISSWMVAHKFPSCGIWTSRGKPMAEAYIDDRAVLCNPHALGRVAYKLAMKEVKRLITRANRVYQNLGLGELKGGKNHASVRQITRKDSRRSKK